MSSLSHHEDEENEEDKRCEVDRSKHWIRLLYFRELKVAQDDAELGETTQTQSISTVRIDKEILSGQAVMCVILSQAGLESAEVVDLGAKHQVGELSVGQEDDEEHDGEAHEVFSAARHGAGELAHGLVEVDELKKLRTHKIHG